MGRFRHLNFRLARLCGIQSKVSQENFAKAWHQQGHQVETARWLCLIILWNSRWLRAAATMIALDGAGTQFLASCLQPPERLISGAPKSTKLVDLVKEEDWEVHLESILIKSNRIHVPLLSKIMFHQFPCGLTTKESVVDQIADFLTLTGMHEAVDAAVSCCAAQGAGCENAKFPFVGKTRTTTQFSLQFLLAYHFACKGVVTTPKRCQCHVNAGCSWETLDDVGDLEPLPIDDFIDSDRRFCWKDSITIEIMWRRWSSDRSSHSNLQLIAFCAWKLLTPFWIPLRVVDSVQEHARIQVSSLRLSHRNSRPFQLWLSRTSMFL